MGVTLNRNNFHEAVFGDDVGRQKEVSSIKHLGISLTWEDPKLYLEPENIFYMNYRYML